MITITAVYKVAGVILAGHLLEHAAQVYGHGDKVPIIKVVVYVVCFGMGMHAVMAGIDMVKNVFHVMF